MLCHVGTCRAVHKHTVVEVHLYDMLYHGLYARSILGLEQCVILLQIDAICIVCSPVAVRNADNVYFQSALLQQTFLLQRDLLQKASSYSAHPTDKHVKVLVGG